MTSTNRRPTRKAQTEKSAGPARQRQAKPGQAKKTASQPKKAPAKKTPNQPALQKRQRPAQQRTRPATAQKGTRNPHNASAGLGPSEPMRIAKAIARAGLCSRRDAERWIAEGRVRLNGKILTTPAVEVGPKDRIHVDGAPLPQAEPVRLWRYHKQRGFVTTHKDPQQRPTVFDALPDELPRVISIGRLDYNTEGLLLLTNDGALARHLELPATGWLRRYRVRAFGRVSKTELDSLKDGVTIEGVNYGPITAEVDSVQGGNIWLTLALREGKNREVRRILEHLDLKVNRLIRISFGPFQLLDLKPGIAESVRRRMIADQLGAKVARDLNIVPDTQKSPARPNRQGAKTRPVKTQRNEPRPKKTRIKAGDQ